MLEELQDSAGARGGGVGGWGSTSTSDLQDQPLVLGPLSSLLTCGMQNTKKNKSRSG